MWYFNISILKSKNNVTYQRFKWDCRGVYFPGNNSPVFLNVNIINT
jgi:hypothetical protein